MSDVRNDNNDGGMTPEELGRYKELLSAAYPYEKGKIRDSVMARIASESAAKKNKTPWKTIALRFGSVAAALVLVCTICISVMPRLEKFVAEDSFAPEAENEAVFDNAGSAVNSESINKGDSRETAPAEKPEAPADADEELIYSEDSLAYCTLTAITEDGAGYDLSYTSCGDSVAPSQDDGSAPTENECENVAPESAPEAAAYGVKNLMTFSAPASCVSTVTECAHSVTFMNSYHEIPAILKNLVGADEYAAWEAELEDAPCKNIVGFIDRFGVSREVFTELVATTDLYYTCDYPIDLLYGGDAAAIEKYYSEGGSFDECLTRYAEYRFKLALGDAVPDYNAWRAAEGFDSVSTWSIAQLVHDMDMERDELEAIYLSTTESFLEVYEGAKVPTYDFDAIVECGHEIRRAITGGALGYEIDALYRK
ncbi:MAG: hypothetical protein J6L71_00475 [Clostridia bacterium]|nr:hypothetical protein [Clostridia bacterium]